MFETVIVPLDGSELAEAAIVPAREIAEKFGSQLLLLRAIEPMSHLIATQPPSLLESPASAEANVELIEQVVHAERDEATKYLDEVQARIGGRTEYAVVEGQPGDAIAEVAQERGAGLVVMSSHGRGGLGRVIFGSVADTVLRNSHIPVMLIRIPDEDDEKS
jgi:nucleotide-binding universal stress UspA family protein